MCPRSMCPRSFRLPPSTRTVAPPADRPVDSRRGARRLRGRARDHRDRHVLRRPPARHRRVPARRGRAGDRRDRTGDVVRTRRGRSRTSRDRAHRPRAHRRDAHPSRPRRRCVAHRRTLPERDGVGARTRRTASRRSHAPARERDLDLRGGDDGVAVRARRTRCGPADPSSGRRRPDRARPSASRDRLDTRPREASRGARGLRHRSRLHGRRARHPPARRAGRSVRPHHRPTTISSSRSPRSNGSESGRVERCSCSRTSDRWRRSTASATSRSSGSERGPMRSARRSTRLERRDDALDEIMRVLREVARADARDRGRGRRSTCRPWRRCRASG